MQRTPIEPREVPGLTFTAADVAAFAPLVPVLAAFAQQYGLEWSRVRDFDPINPYAAHFLTWRGHSPRTGGRCSICVRVLEPFDEDVQFGITTHGGTQSGEWAYLVEEGSERLRDLLEQARSVAEPPR